MLQEVEARFNQHSSIDLALHDTGSAFQKRVLLKPRISAKDFSHKICELRYIILSLIGARCSAVINSDIST